MGIDATRIRVHARSFLVISIRTCYRSVCKHPFLVGFLCFLTFLYRSFPFLFSLLVSVSPVLICTSLLLGTLLSFGELNIPEIEKEKEEEEEEEDIRHDIASLKRRIVEDATVVVEGDEGFSIERFEGKRRDTEKTIEEERLVKEHGEIELGGDLGEYMPLADRSSRKIQFEKQVVEEVESRFDVLKLEKKRETREERGIGEALSRAEVVENHFSLLRNAENGNLESEHDGSPREFIGDQKGDYLDYSQDLSWKGAGNDNEEDDDEDDADDSDSESDRAESSSPDASMADIMPMLDELHPLLDEEAPQTALVSHVGSYAGSEQSHKSKESSIASEDDVENQADGDNDDDNEDEDAREGKEDESKSAIKWTEDDEKNLMDLGSLELERNQRLENLIARRRARRNMKLMAEKNLIDLDGADHPTNIPPISTAKHNPFDFPYDDDVPGSAPSILLPRQNPFDLPYDSNEEKPDLKGDGFHQEFSVTQPREPVFRRHESFSVGPSALGVPRQERQDFRWTPYFVPEQFVTEGTSYHTFQRQLSEASDSKLSSVPDTESVSSAVEDEDKQLNEENASQDAEMNSSLDHGSVLVCQGSLPSQDADQANVEQVENSDIEITLGGIDREADSSLSQSGEAATVELNTSEILMRMEAGDDRYSSRSSMSSLSEIDEKIPDVGPGYVRTGPEIQQPSGGGQIEESLASTQTSLDSDFNFMHEEADDNRQRELVLDPCGEHIGESVKSTQTSLDSDPLSMRAVDDNQHKEPVSKQKVDDVEDSDISTHTSPESRMHVMSAMEDNDQNNVPELLQRDNNIEESGSGIAMPTSHHSDFQFASGMVDDHHHEDPVYDSSPPSVEKYLSFSSNSSDTLAEISEMGSPAAAAEFPVNKTVVHSRSMEEDISGYKEMYEGSLQAQSLHGNESGDVTEISKHVVLKRDLSGLQSYFDCEDEFLQLETVSVDSPPFSSEHGLVKRGEEYKEESSCNMQEQLHSSNSDAGTTIGPQHDALEKSNSISSSEEITLPALDGLHPPSDTKLPSSEAESLKEPAAQLQPKQDQVHSSTFDSYVQVNGHQSVDENFHSVTSSSVHRPSYDSDLPARKEMQPAEQAKQVSAVYLDISSSKAKHVEEHSVSKEEKLHFEQDQVHSTRSDAMIGAAFNRDVDFKNVSSGSSYLDVRAEERSSLEKQLSWSDKSMVEPSINIHDEMQESSMSMAESTDEVSVANDENVAEYPQDRMSANFTSAAAHSNSAPPDILENKSVVGVDSTISNFDEIVYEDSRDLSDHSNYLAEAYRSPAEAQITEEEGEIKEIDEGLLSELDTVGDFSVKEVAGKSLHNGQLPEGSSTGNPKLELLPKDSDLTEIKPELQVLEVRPVEDINLAFKQLHEGADAEEAILPSMIRDQLAVDGSKGPEDASLDLRVVEARSLQDINVAVKEVLETNAEELPKLSDSKDEPEVNDTKELPVLEVKTHKDIDLAFKQLHEGADVEEVILPSMIEDQLAVDGSKGPEVTNSDLCVVEARSLEDIHVALKEVSEGNTEELPKLPDSKDGPGEVNEVGSTKELPVLEVKTHEDIDLAFKQLHEGVDVEEVIVPSMIEDQLAVVDFKGPEDDNSDLPVVEARSLEDINVALKEVSEGHTKESLNLADSKDGPGDVDEMNTPQNLPVLEVRMHEDIAFAFKQLHEGAAVDEVILPSTTEQQLAVDEPNNPGKTSSDLQVVESGRH